MKNMVIVLIVLAASSFAVNCGGEARQSEAGNEGAKTISEEANKVTVSQTKSSGTYPESRDADDISKSNSVSGNKTDKIDADDFHRANQNANVKNTNRIDRDDAGKRRDPDDGRTRDDDSDDNF